ncbi:hypothetical protein TRFO_29747 [Tritrichomonas foetus]|uniref:Intimal thickness related receptor IRP domain-containing protein n=1 Tax=Tritrichomonas foetus TaxID=1144522 RepID=A0A1J4K0E5_9EUKA|nr:hypothetical protein TRFO_29747 [Tritrichomonas foetus]|eukprot:OHT02989.1 hypothetical protein TRFO_29747 [Tritrichomonas foetus]
MSLFNLLSIFSLFRFAACISNFDKQIKFFDIKNPNDLAHPFSIYKFNLCFDTLENSYLLRYKYFYNYMILERIGTSNFNFHFNVNSSAHNFCEYQIDYFQMINLIRLIRNNSLYTISFNGETKYFPIGITRLKYPLIFRRFNFLFFTKNEKIVWWNISMEDPKSLTAHNKITFSAKATWLEVPNEINEVKQINFSHFIENNFNHDFDDENEEAGFHQDNEYSQNQNFNHEYQSSQNLYKSDNLNHSNKVPKFLYSKNNVRYNFFYKYFNYFIIMNYILYIGFQYYQIVIETVPSHLNFSRYTKNLPFPFLFGTGIQLSLIFILFFTFNLFFKFSTNYSKTIFLLICFFLITSPISGYSSYRLSFGGYRHHMKILLGLYMLFTGIFCISYSFAIAIRTNNFDNDHSIVAVFYISLAWGLTILGSLYSKQIQKIKISNYSHTQKPNQIYYKKLSSKNSCGNFLFFSFFGTFIILPGLLNIVKVVIFDDFCNCGIVLLSYFSAIVFSSKCCMKFSNLKYVYCYFILMTINLFLIMQCYYFLYKDKNLYLTKLTYNIFTISLSIIFPLMTFSLSLLLLHTESKKYTRNDQPNPFISPFL